jgi:erythromycin esterase
MSYDVSVDDRDYVGDFADTNKGYENLVLIAHPRVAIERPTDNLTRKHLGSFCHALDDQHGVLDEIAASVKDARIIGLGEATHGTREFTEWRTRIVERLAVGGRLTTIGLEAGWEETLRIDDYVRRGIGTAREAVSSLRYFPWRTKEFVDLVENVRAINVNRKASDRVEFFGIEVDPPKQMVGSMLARLQEDGPLQSFAETSLRGVREWDDWSSVVELGASQREQIKGALAKLMRRLQSSTGTNGEVASDRDLAMQSLSAMEMTIKGAEAEGTAFLGRDRLMAESQLLLLAQPEKQRKIAVWAHNVHIAKAFMDGDMPSGSFLYRKLGDRYVALATLFFEGSLLASRGPGGELIEYLAPAPPLHFTEHDLAAAPGKVGCFVNLLEASKDSRVREWMRRPRPLRIYGAFEISEHFPWPPEKLSDLWSSILFVRHSTASEGIQK